MTSRQGDSPQKPAQRSTNHFFVDEAGDPTLFDKRGRIIVGHEGVSHTFMIGFVSLVNPEQANHSLGTLRSNLLADPYFKGVPSLRPETKKTALFFHAKDDLPEVRREMFKLLTTIDAKVLVAIRRKNDLAQSAKKFHILGQPNYSPDKIYSDLVKRLFKNVLHKADENRIIFARRGKADVSAALDKAIRQAKINFESAWQKGIDRPTHVHLAHPSEFAGLQVIDYFLWALQRLYERREDRYFNLYSLKVSACYGP